MIAMVEWFWYLVLLSPAYICHSIAVICNDGIPIDGGKKLLGKRIFGDNKTVGGFIGGVAYGGIIGLLILAAVYLMFGVVITDNVLLPWYLSFLGMSGDLLGSFIKRRLNLEPGSKSLFLDVYPFVFIMLIGLACYDFSWFVNAYPWYSILIILVLTPVLHRLTNTLGFMAKLKKCPY